MSEAIVSSLREFMLPRGDLKKFLKQWMSLHANDHQKFVRVLNNIREVKNLGVLKEDEYDMRFEIGDVQSWNKFLLANEESHKILYVTFNEVGLDLLVPIAIEPRFNLIKKVSNLNERLINEFLLQEYQVHTLFARALNLMLENLQ